MEWFLFWCLINQPLLFCNVFEHFQSDISVPVVTVKCLSEMFFACLQCVFPISCNFIRFSISGRWCMYYGLCTHNPFLMVPNKSFIASRISVVTWKAFVSSKGAKAENKKTYFFPCGIDLIAILICLWTVMDCFWAPICSLWPSTSIFTIFF